MSRPGAKGPRPSDVARWVAELAQPEPSRWIVEEHKAWRRERDRAHGQLRSWGLDDAGNPAAPTPEAGNEG